MQITCAHTQGPSYFLWLSSAPGEIETRAPNLYFPGVNLESTCEHYRFATSHNKIKLEFFKLTVKEESPHGKGKYKFAAATLRLTVTFCCGCPREPL